MPSSTDVSIKRVMAGDDLQRLAEQINAADWDEENDMGDYSADSIAAFVADENRILLVAYLEEQLAGIVSAFLHLKPYEQERWLYIDEVDTAEKFRRQGVGKAMMTALCKIAAERNGVEAWLGTEIDNVPALALYRSLQPDDEETFVGFTYRLSSTKR